MYGTPGNDRLRGELFLQTDVIHGLGGNDEIIGGDGHDVICGGAGDDKLDGRSSGDHLFGGPGDDILLGEGGDDELHGEDGIDRCEGGSGDDVSFLCESGNVERRDPRPSGGTTTTLSPPARGPTVTLSDASVRPGESVTVTGSGFPEGTSALVELLSTPVRLGSLSVTGGTASGTFTIPRSTAPGDHHIVLTAQAPDGTITSASAALRVEGALPRTGSRTLEVARWGLLLVGLGLLASGRAQTRRAA
jgi:Ca2+-binding RTX toxin-like protein